MKTVIVASADHMMALHTLTLAKYGGSLLIFYCFVTMERLDESSDCDLVFAMGHVVWDQLFISLFCVAYSVMTIQLRTNLNLSTKPPVEIECSFY